MSEKSGFFNAELVNEAYDRVYLAESFAAFFAKFISNGIFVNPATQLQVIQNDSADMNIKVSVGSGFVNGYWYENTAVLIKAIAAASGTTNRIDAVMLRWDGTNRQVSIVIVQGAEYGDAAVAPTPTRNDSTYDLVLAHINVPKGTTAITNASITDKRSDATLCGFVTGLVDQIDATNLFSQFTTSFNTWFQTMKDQLSTDAAGNLQLQIDGKASTSHTHVVANITDFPTALPADGGDADTVTGYTVGKSVPANAVFTDTIPVQQSAKLTVAGWQGTAAPYTQVVSVTGVTVSNNVLFDFASDITASELDVGMSAMLRATGQAAGQMTIKAFGDKPTVELPVQFIILG